MDIIQNLDLEWFWLGYSVGFNSRKKLIDSPNQVVNLGKQGLKKIPTEKQKVSFFIGMKLGRGRITQNLDIITQIQYQDKKPHSNKGKYLTLEVKDKEVERGATFNIPLILCNNSVDNRGYCGYQAKLQYNPTHIRFNSIKSTNPSLSFKYQHNASTGIVLIQGMREEVGYEDCFLCEMSFTVLGDAPSSTEISVCGPGGAGTASDILTKINGELYYIMPVCLESGTIKIKGDEPKPKPTPPPEAISPPPQGDSSTLVGSGSNFTYDFEMDLNHIGGVGGGATGKVQITFGDGSSCIVDIPLQEGSHRYQGKLPLPLPSMKPGPIRIEIWVEPNDPDDEYYWFIKAGALWGFEIETPRDEVGQIPIKPPERNVYERLIIFDTLEVFLDEPSGPIYVDVSEDLHIIDNSFIYLIKLPDLEVDVSESIGLIDSVVTELITVPPRISSVSELMGVVDNVEIEIIKVKPKEEIVREEMGIQDTLEVEIIKLKPKQSNSTESLSTIDNVEVWQE